MSGFEGVPPDVLARWRTAHLDSAQPRRDPGPDYLSREQLERVWGLSTAGVNSRLRKLRAAGRIEVATRDVVMVDGRARGIPVYRIVDASTSEESWE